jgi:adenine-specific DNA-methyltransferase
VNPPTIHHANGGGSAQHIPYVLPDWPKIDCLLTDPPYGIDAQSTFGKDPKDIEKYQQKVANDKTPEQAIADFDLTVNAVSPFLADICEIYIFSDIAVDPQWQPYLRSLEASHGIRFMQILIWDKGYPGLGDFTYNWGKGYEIIYYLKRGNRPVPYRRSGVIAVDKVRPGTGIHPMEKPQKLLSMLIDYSTDDGQFVFDPYAGSGSTVLAAASMGREALGMELDEKYLSESRARLPLPGLFSL